MFPDLITASGHASWWLSLVATATVCLAIAGSTLAYRRLRLQKLCLDTAIDNMSQGLTMFDRSGRLVLCNSRYLEMYGLSPDVIKPGCTANEIVRHRIATGTLSASEAERYVDARQTTLGHGEIQSKDFVLPNGRSIVVTRRPMKGGGWVATHDDTTERRQAEARIAHMAHHDGLTGLANRVLLRERLESELLRVQRGQHLAILYIDIDHFKTINDTLGHSVGDALLRSVADRMRGCIRETDTIARLGGDEFAVLQTGFDGPPDASELAQRLRDAIALPHDAENKTLAAQGRSIDDIVRAAGYKTQIMPRVPIVDSINAARTIFPNIWFDREKCAEGLACLRHYRYEVDPETGQFSRNPLHDQYSHGADAFRYIALMIKEPAKRKKQPQIAMASSWMG